MRRMAWERPVEPEPRTPCSSRSALRTPMRVRWYRMLHPMTPPPMTTTSAVLFMWTPNQQEISAAIIFAKGAEVTAEIAFAPRI